MRLCQDLRRGERGYLAALIGRSLRSLQLWKRQAGSVRRAGRPSASVQEWRASLWRVARCWRWAGRTAGWRELRDQLGPSVPVRRLQKLLSLLKRRWRRRERERLSRGRMTVALPGGDVLWSQDSTQLGRSESGRAVHGEVVRDAGSLRTLLLAVGPPSHGQDVVEQLQVLKSRRGALPLVWSTDNGPPYRSAVVERFLERQRVVHLRNEPRTPQHNSWAERAIGELKAESGLRGDGVLASSADALERLAAARERLDGRRLRTKLGGRTAVQADRSDRCWYSAADRERFYADTRRAQQEAAAGARTARERRRAERRAVLEALERLNNESTHRGDASPAAEKREGIS
jgi:transposase InsO family protein